MKRFSTIRCTQSRFFSSVPIGVMQGLIKVDRLILNQSTSTQAQANLSWHDNKLLNKFQSFILIHANTTIFNPRFFVLFYILGNMKRQNLNQRCLKKVYNIGYLKTSLVKVSLWPFMSIVCTKQITQYITFLCRNTQHTVQNQQVDSSNACYYIGTR